MKISSAIGTNLQISKSNVNFGKIVQVDNEVYDAFEKDGVTKKQVDSLSMANSYLDHIYFREDEEGNPVLCMGRWFGGRCSKFTRSDIEDPNGFYKYFKGKKSAENVITCSRDFYDSSTREAILKESPYGKTNKDRTTLVEYSGTNDFTLGKQALPIDNIIAKRSGVYIEDNNDVGRVQAKRAFIGGNATVDAVEAEEILALTGGKVNTGIITGKGDKSYVMLMSPAQVGTIQFENKRGKVLVTKGDDGVLLDLKPEQVINGEIEYI